MHLFHDFLPLWASGRLILNGQNPYDDTLITQTLVDAGVSLSAYHGGFAYPPWTFWFFSLLGTPSLKTSMWLWCALSFAAVLYISRLILKHLSISIPDSALLLSLICFIPFLKVLFFGQINIICLIALLIFINSLQSKAYLVSGISASLLLIKPHISICLLVPVFVFKIKEIKLLLGFLLGFLIQFYISSFLYSVNLVDFFSMSADLLVVRKMVTQVTLSSLFQFVLGISIDSIYFLLLGLISALIYAFHNGLGEKELYILTAISLLFAPYAWSHDQLVLLPIYLATYFYFWQKAATKTSMLMVLHSATILLFISGAIVNRELWMIYWPVCLIALICAPDILNALGTHKMKT